MYLKNLADTASVYELDAMQSSHITKVLRMKEGQEIELFNGSGLSYKARILSSTNKYTRVETLSDSMFVETLSERIIAVVPFIKKENLFFMTQKLTEIGVTDLMYYRPDKLDQSLLKKDLFKLNKKLEDIIIGGCKQSGINFLPSIKCFKDLETCLNDIPVQTSNNFVCFFDLDASERLAEADFSDANEYIFITGAESGFSDRERFNMEEKNIAVRSLGKNILRAETAPIAGITLFQSHIGNI